MHSYNNQVLASPQQLIQSLGILRSLSIRRHLDQTVEGVKFVITEGVLEPQLCQCVVHRISVHEFYRLQYIRKLLF